MSLCRIGSDQGELSMLDYQQFFGRQDQDRRSFRYCQGADMKASMPLLFDILEEPEADLVEEAMEVAA